MICSIDSTAINIRISSRMTRKLGCFEVKKSSVLAKPRLSIIIATKALSEDELFYDVIRHEYAHAVVYLRYPHQKHVHDNIWKSVCAEVGCTPKASIKSNITNEVKRRDYKYVITCKSCGAKSFYKNNCKVVQIAQGAKRGYIVCSNCGSKDFTLSTKGH